MILCSTSEAPRCLIAPVESKGCPGYNHSVVSFTAKYTKIDSGYMGQLIEWPEVVTEGADIEECRSMLRDALREMVQAYQQLGRDIPPENEGDLNEAADRS